MIPSLINILSTSINLFSLNIYGSLNKFAASVAIPKGYSLIANMATTELEMKKRFNNP
jgi:hypothetical protein